MPENYGIIVDPAKSGIKQLFARNADVQHRPATLAAGQVYERGCLVMGADPTTPMTKVTTGALPAATDIMGIVTERVDATAANVLAGIYIKGEYVAEAVWAASAALAPADKLVVIEAGVKVGINLVNAAYGDMPGAY